jgi:hypothetical protein
MCHNPDPLQHPLYEPNAVHCLLPCTSALVMRCPLMAPLPIQLGHEGQYYATHK